LVSAIPALADDLFLDDDFDGEFIFDDSEFSNQDTDTLLQESPYQWWLKQGLVYDPKSLSEPTDSFTDMHLQAETTLGLTGFAKVDIKASQNWNTGEFDAEIYSTAIQISTEQGAFKLGRYINSWGEVEGAGVLDIINLAPALTDPDRDFKPQWLLGYSHYMGARELHVLANVQPDVAQVTGMTANVEAASEWGVGYKVTGSGSDWALYAGQFIQNAPTLGVANGLPVLTAYQYDLLGFSYNRASGDNLLKWDMAWKQGLGQQVGSGLTKVERLDMALGAEINAGDRQWNLSIASNYLPKHTANYQTVIIDPLTLQPSWLPTSQWYTSYGLGVSDSFANDEFSWSVNLIGAVNGSMTGLISELTWDYADNLQWRFFLAGLEASADTAYASMDGLQRIGAELEYHF
jgi:hypothetical protein